MSKKEASVAKPIGDKLKKYVAKEEVKEIYAALEVGAKVLDTTNNTIKFLSKPKGVDNGGARGAEAPPDFSP